MKKELLLSSILVLNPVSLMAQEEISNIVAKENFKKLNLSYLSFVSAETGIDTFYKYNLETREIEEFEKEYYIRVSFTQPNYQDNIGEDVGAEFEVIIQKVTTDGMFNHYAIDSVIYVKQVSKTKFEVFDCDSSTRCSFDAETRGMFYIVDTPYGKTLKVKENTFRDSEWEYNYFEFSKFFEVR